MWRPSWRLTLKPARSLGQQRHSPKRRSPSPQDRSWSPQDRTRRSDRLASRLQATRGLRLVSSRRAACSVCQTLACLRVWFLSTVAISRLTPRILRRASGLRRLPRHHRPLSASASRLPPRPCHDGRPMCTRRHGRPAHGLCRTPTRRVRPTTASCGRLLSPQRRACSTETLAARRAASGSPRTRRRWGGRRCRCRYCSGLHRAPCGRRWRRAMASFIRRSRWHMTRSMLNARASMGVGTCCVGACSARATHRTCHAPHVPRTARAIPYVHVHAHVHI